MTDGIGLPFDTTGLPPALSAKAEAPPPGKVTDSVRIPTPNIVYGLRYNDETWVMDGAHPRIFKSISGAKVAVAKLARPGYHSKRPWLFIDLCHMHVSVSVEGWFVEVFDSTEWAVPDDSGRVEWRRPGG